MPHKHPAHPPAREHAAHEVFVTGDFDGWNKTVQLEKEDGIFKKTVELPKTKHQYKVRACPSAQFCTANTLWL